MTHIMASNRPARNLPDCYDWTAPLLRCYHAFTSLLLHQPTTFPRLALWVSCHNPTKICRYRTQQPTARWDLHQVLPRCYGPMLAQNSQDFILAIHPCIMWLMHSARLAHNRLAQARYKYNPCGYAPTQILTLLHKVFPFRYSPKTVKKCNVLTDLYGRNSPRTR